VADPGQARALLERAAADARDEVRAQASLSLAMLA
jgi:hypothetical protein